MNGTRWMTVGAMAAVCALAGCGGDDAETPSDSASSTGAASGPASASPAAADGPGCEEAEGKTVGYSQPLPDPNFAIIEQVISKALGEYGAELKPTNANLDPGKQLSDIQALLQQQVSVLIANPVDPNATKPVFDRVRQAGIPIVAQDTTVGGPFFTNVTADVEDAAAQGAEVLKEAVGDGKVTAVEGPPFAEVLVRENNAFKQKAEEIGLNVVESQVNGQITPEGAKTITESWKQKYPDLAGIWTFNDTSALGVGSSLTGDFTPKLVSINGQPEAIPLVKSGRILATFDLQQDRIGQALAYAALAALCDREVPDTIVVPAKKIDASNVDDYRPLSERVDDPFVVELEERDGRSYVADS